MFDLPAGPGLVDVLRGEAMAEEAIAVHRDAGGFHFLPAGSARVDPGRLLHGDRLARLLAGARESFDIVIVDTPPVLPVPDALTIGRWVNGAVLAVRFDDSRFPLVERAHRRLAASASRSSGPSSTASGVRSVLWPVPPVPARTTIPRPMPEPGRGRRMTDGPGGGLVFRRPCR